MATAVGSMNASGAAAPMSKEEKKVIFASSLGTVFEWYDFYLYGSLAVIIGKQFFAGLDPTAQFIAALLAFAAGFIVRPFGALVFGRMGDMIGRKYTFLVTILIMGLATFIVGLLPSYASIGVAAPIRRRFGRLRRRLGRRGGMRRRFRHRCGERQRHGFRLAALVRLQPIQILAHLGSFVQRLGRHVVNQIGRAHV